MEFHAVIVCGPGKGLTPFSKIRSTGTTKALLPIANKPMIEYVLDWCEKAFFPKITVITDYSSNDDISLAVEDYKLNKIQKKSIEREIDIVGSTEEVYQYTSSIDVIPVNSTSNGEILNHLYTSYLSTGTLESENFVILPCDFITNLPPQVLIEAYRNKSETDLGLVVHYKNTLDIEDKKNTIFQKNYTIYTELSDGQQQLLDIYSKEDVEFHKALKIRTQMSWKYPNSIISTQLLNSGIYFGSAKQIFQIFKENSSKYNELYFRTRPLSKVYRDLARRSWKHSTSKLTVGFIKIPTQATFFRSNNLPVLMEANRYFMKFQGQKSIPLHHSKDKSDKANANISNDSIVGEKVEFGDHTYIKRTVLGTNCKIGKKVKLTGCLILNDVTIEDEVQLENCIIGHHAVIHSKVKLTNCNVESTHDVAKCTQSKGDTLLCFTLEGLVSEDIENAIDDSDLDGSTTGDDDTDLDDFDDEYADNADGLFAY